MIATSGSGADVLRGRAEPDELTAVVASLSGLDRQGTPSKVLADLLTWRRYRRAALLPRGR